MAKQWSGRCCLFPLCTRYNDCDDDVDFGNSALVEHLSANMDSELFVRARFHVDRGRWEIFSGTGEKEKCSSAQLLSVLEDMAHQATQTTATPTLGPGLAQAPKRPWVQSGSVSSELQAPSDPTAKRRKLPSRNRQQAVFVPVMEQEAPAPAQEAAGGEDIEQHQQVAPPPPSPVPLSNDQDASASYLLAPYMRLNKSPPPFRAAIRHFASLLPAPNSPLVMSCSRLVTSINKSRSHKGHGTGHQLYYMAPTMENVPFCSLMTRACEMTCHLL